MPGTVTQWIHEFADGDDDAAQRLWERYNERLERLARRRLGSLKRAISDEQDLANAGFASFCRGVQAGRFNRLGSRDDLWRLLLDIVYKKAADQWRRALAQKRLGEVGESALGSPDESRRCLGVAGAEGPEPTPEYVAMLREECERFLQFLENDEKRQIFLLSIERHTQKEMAEKTGLPIRTLQRRVREVRDKLDEWREKYGIDSDDCQQNGGGPDVDGGITG